MRCIVSRGTELADQEQHHGMFHSEEDAQHQKDQEFLAKFGYKQELDRSLGFLSTFAIAFGFVSATNGFFALFYYGLDTGGPAGVFWSWPIVVFGQLMVALVFAEAASHFPLAGGVYQWAKHLWNGTWGWFTAWMFLFALLVTVAGVAFGAAPIACGLFGWEGTRWTLFAIAIFFTVVPMALNIWGVKIMAFVNNIGTITELIGMSVLGVVLIVVVLVTSKPHQTLGVLFDTAGTGAAGYAGPFLAAMLTAAWVLYGFDTAGSLAEETVNPSKEVPRAIIAGVVVTAIVSTVWLIGTLLAIPNVQDAIAQGPNVLPWLLRFHFPGFIADLFLVIVLTAIFVCSLSIQAATARLLFAMSRDHMLPDKEFFGKVNTSTKTPVRSAVFVAVFCVAVLLYQDQVARVIAWATVGVYIVYQMVVFAAMVARTKGWPKERAHFNLGVWGWPVSLIAFGYGVFMIINLSWPRTPDAAWYDNYLVSVSLLVILVVGIIVFVLFKASGHDLSRGIHDIERVQTSAAGETTVERVGGVMGVPGGVDPENPYVVEDTPVPEPEG
jgi:amino acid transporter